MELLKHILLLSIVVETIMIIVIFVMQLKIYRYRSKIFVTFGYRLKYCSTLSTYGGAECAVLDVAAGVNTAIAQEHCAAYQKIRIWSITFRSHVDRLLAETGNCICVDHL